MIAEPCQRVCRCLRTGVHELAVPLAELFVGEVKLLGTRFYGLHHVVQRGSQVGELSRLRDRGPGGEVALGHSGGRSLQGREWLDDGPHDDGRRQQAKSRSGCSGYYQEAQRYRSGPVSLASQIGHLLEFLGGCLLQAQPKLSEDGDDLLHRGCSSFDVTALAQFYHVACALRKAEPTDGDGRHALGRPPGYRLCETAHGGGGGRLNLRHVYLVSGHDITLEQQC